MATANYQTVNKLTFYPSYPLYCYASGIVRSIYGSTSFDNELGEEGVLSLISLNPSKIHNLLVTEDSYLRLKLGDERKTDFLMVLGHNFNSQNQKMFLTPLSEQSEIYATSVVNDCFNQTPDYNGWSLLNIDYLSQNFLFHFSNIGPCNIGSILWGRKWEAPQTVDINQSLKINYGYKKQTTIGGKTISTLNYDKTGKWGGLDAWELFDDANMPSENTSSRNGVRTWSVNFSFLQDSKMMSQNNMLSNSNNWTADSDSEYSTAADGTSSAYNTNDSQDFFSNIIKMTMGGHLPIVVNISDSKNSDQWAIVRISDYSITQANPKFVNYKMTLEEQV